MNECLIKNETTLRLPVLCIVLGSHGTKWVRLMSQVSCRLDRDM